MDLNKRLFFLIQRFKNQTPYLNLLMIFGAEVIIYISIGLTIGYSFLKHGRYQDAFILSLISIPIALILILFIHLFIKEKRPFIKFHFKPLISFYKNLSFPSTHTTIMTILTFSHIYFQTELSIFFVFSLLWISIARVYIGVHYPQDIAGGLFTGISALILGAIVGKY